MKNLIYTICSPNYSLVLAETIENISSYALSVGADFRVYNADDYNNSKNNRRSHWVRKFETMGRISDNYEKIMYLDCDILIVKSENIFDLPINNIAGRPAGYTTWGIRQNALCRDKFPMFDPDYFVNGGLIIGEPEALKFLGREVCKMWENPELNSDDSEISDEVYIAEVLRKHFQDFTRLEDRWNSSYKQKRAVPNFVHFMCKNINTKIQQLKVLRK